MVEGLCLSKEEGGKWGIEHLPPEYRSMIAEALECYASDKAMAVEKKSANDFVKKVMGLIKDPGLLESKVLS